MNRRTEEHVWTVASAIIAVLFAGNVYIAKHSLDRLDTIEGMVFQLKQEIAVLHATLDTRSKSSFSPSKKFQPNIAAN